MCVLEIQTLFSLLAKSKIYLRLLIDITSFSNSFSVWLLTFKSAHITIYKNIQFDIDFTLKGFHL